MKELISEDGGRHCYGSEFVEAQAEVLQPLQGFFEQFGAIVISGCEITDGGGGTWDIAAGIVGIEHADGYKLARWAGDTGLTLPGYMTISKTTQTGNYGQPGSITVQDVSDTYTAIYTQGAPVANNDTELVIPDQPFQPNSFIQGFKKLSNVTQQTFAFNITEAEGTVYIIVNKSARLAYIKGNIDFKNIAGWTFGVMELTLVPKATVVANALVGTEMDGMGERHWTAMQVQSTGGLVADTGGHPINSVNMRWGALGIMVDARKTSGTAYSVYFNAVVPLDL